MPQAPTLRKIWKLLIPAERRGVLVLLGLMAIGMLLETLGIGLVIPAIGVMLRDDLATHYHIVSVVLTWLGNPSPPALIKGAMLGLVCIYFVKNMFLAFFAWWQIRFTSGLHVRLSQRLFTIYLRQPYAFHLQRNSAQLFRNVTSEVGIFVGVITNYLVILTEGLVLTGISALLLAVEPLGALIVGLVLGLTAWGFHVVTRRHIFRWGELRMHHAGLSTQHLMQGLGSAKDVKLLGREADFLAQFHYHNEQGARVNRHQTTLQALPRMWLELLTVTGLATLVITMLAQGRGATSIVPTLGLFAASVAYLLLMRSIDRRTSGVSATP
jgi:ABC-type multidrug transport system fused ATPase/permease subunit